MLSKKDKVTGFASGSTTLISRTTELVGDVSFSGNLEIEGRIQGNVSAEDGSDARVRIMDQGVVEGEIHVPTVVVNGQVNGDVYSSRHVELAAKAQVRGNVHYNVIEIVKGAQVNGNLVYGGEQLQAADDAAAAESAAPDTRATSLGDAGPAASKLD